MRREHGRVAGLISKADAEDPRISEGRRQLAGSKLELHIRETVLTWPDLTPEDRAVYAELLSGGRDG